MSDRRPKRRCVAAKAQLVPSAIHYVGYVEDNETPEMIMKKFEELERIQKAAEARRQQQQQLQQQQGPNGNPQQAEGGPGPSLPGPRPQYDATAVAAPGSETNPAAPPTSSGPESHSPSPQNPSNPEPHLPPDQLPTAATAGANPDADDQMLLDDEALLEVFKQTSILNVRASALYGSDAMLGFDGGGGAVGADGIAYGMEDMLFAGGDFGATPSDMEEDELQLMKGFWSDEDFELGGGGSGRSRDSGGGARRRRTGSSSGRTAGGHRGLDGEGPPPGSAREGRQSSRTGGPPAQSRQAAMNHQVVMQYNRDTNALIRRRVTSAGGGADGGGGGLVQLRVPPPPLPLSWGRTVRPYQPPEPYPPPDVSKSSSSPQEAPVQANASESATAAVASTDPAATATTSRGFESHNMVAFPFDSALGGKQYIAIMVNAGWQPPGAADAFEGGREAEVMRGFLSLPIPRLCPRGFIFVWAHKGLLQAVCRALAGWGYVYVENLTWVHLTPANAIATSQRGRHFRRSHSTLLIFRREGEGRDIELRHQRNPDVVFDCIRTLPDRSGWDIPSEVLTTIETMLPGGRGAFLELWAPRGQRRPGWDHVSEVRAVGFGGIKAAGESFESKSNTCEVSNCLLTGMDAKSVQQHDDVYAAVFALVGQKPNETYEGLARVLKSIKDADPAELKELEARKALLEMMKPSVDPLRDEYEKAAAEELDENGIPVMTLSRASSSFILDGPGDVKVDNFTPEGDAVGDLDDGASDSAVTATALVPQATAAADSGPMAAAVAPVVYIPSAMAKARRESGAGTRPPLAPAAPVVTLEDEIRAMRGASGPQLTSGAATADQTCSNNMRPQQRVQPQPQQVEADGEEGSLLHKQEAVPAGDVAVAVAAAAAVVARPFSVRADTRHEDALWAALQGVDGRALLEDLGLAADWLLVRKTDISPSYLGRSLNRSSPLPSLAQDQNHDQDQDGGQAEDLANGGGSRELGVSDVEGSSQVPRDGGGAVVPTANGHRYCLVEGEGLGMLANGHSGEGAGGGRSGPAAAAGATATATNGASDNGSPLSGDVGRETNTAGEAVPQSAAVPPPSVGGPTFEDVEAFSLDPDFDYDNVQLTVREFPYSALNFRVRR
ncbi:hypothetical protein VOLCADRAFT_98443 [Volvox carteri f. nagariensis]|uniref:Uncharacterized protein n=1 Tax=Volvox carteri f. nagariensis TaxID=3068 RepID=D8UFC6_VOLCA|nr:uncharacterized protein VOLCADRAFT_98443 [Volvox carteri f. nagariensis]EFJ41584.1 hypothetical protein VOLCADRAFT_98443 [Volvox carteri f. nagariensis]|eukprot:XP_002957375.1 hypothetical protein VOLCADRAFT_98443 [Volvox carteri f. nagariensis]